MSKELPQGHRLGDYSIERLLTRNGLQTVYVGQQQSSSRSCRITVYNVDADGEPWQRFKNDLGQLQALSHPYIAELLDVGTADGVAYTAFAQPAGEDLSTRLRRGGALTLREALGLSRQLAAALHAAHRIDVLHRDLTPENIFLGNSTGDAEYEPVLLYGFGAAKLFEGVLSGVALFGHPEYMAPEQITGLSIDVGPATDQYALALIVYQVLSASQPFRAESAGSALLKVVRSSPEHLRALRPDLPTHVDAAVNRGLAKERASRFPDLPAFLAALEAGEKLSQPLVQATEPWLGGSASTDAALSRAMAAGSMTPSLGVVAQGLASAAADAAPVPEIVEDSATVPNTMEAVMKLALPPEKSSPGFSGAQAVKKDSGPIVSAGAATGQESSGPLEIEFEAIEPTPPPLDSMRKKSGASGPNRPKAAAGNSLAMRSGETSALHENSQAEKTDQDGKNVIVTASLNQPQKPTGFAAMLPAALVPYAFGIERGIYLGIGMLLGFILHAVLH